jgi:tricorn protease-like protein
MKTLADLKVGDEVWTVVNGFEKVTSLKNDFLYPIVVKERIYTIEGKYGITDKYPSLFLKNPFEQKIEPKLMLCKFIGWTYENVIVASNGDIFVKSRYTEVKEIEQKKNVEIAIITLDEIAEKFGVDVTQIRIKS